MGTFLSPTGVPSIPTEDAERLIEDAEALAMLTAPCLADEDLSPPKAAAAKAILRGVVLRWNDAGAGAVTQQSAGPFSQTITPQVRRNAFWPSEIKDLQLICKTASSGKAWSIDTVPGGAIWHAAICSLHFGATYCSCGADLTLAGPLYEVDP